MEESLRLFLSIPCPPALSARLAGLQKDLEADTWELRPADSGHFHLTLHFLGATPARLVDDLKRELGAVCHNRRPFDLPCGGLGCFPDDTHPRVVWLGLQDPAHKLADLFEATRRVLNAYRLFKLERELVPHLTLARVSRLSRAWSPALLRGLAPQWADLGTYPVDRLQLMQSNPGRADKPRYEVLADLKLGGES